MSCHDIVIVGPGAMGCGVAGVLKGEGADVALLDYRRARAARIERSGIEFELKGERQRVRVPVYADGSRCGAADITIILVKAFDTRGAAEHAVPCAAGSGAVLTLQNGLANYEVIAETIDRDQVLAGTIVMGCATMDVGQVRISGIGEIVIGSPFENSELAESVSGRLIGHWPADVRHERDIECALWRKVIVNAGINPLTALTGLPNGELVRDELLRATMGELVREARCIAQANGVDAFDTEEEAIEAVEEVCRLTAENFSSMLQDIRGGGRTEIDQICGEIMRRGRDVEARASLCRAMTGLIRGRERAESHDGADDE